jgi:hypothetical protein
MLAHVAEIAGGRQSPIKVADGCGQRLALRQLESELAGFAQPSRSMVIDAAPDNGTSVAVFSETTLANDRAAARASETETSTLRLPHSDHWTLQRFPLRNKYPTLDTDRPVAQVLTFSECGRQAPMTSCPLTQTSCGHR